MNRLVTSCPVCTSTTSNMHNAANDITVPENRKGRSIAVCTVWQCTSNTATATQQIQNRQEYNITETSSPADEISAVRPELLLCTARVDTVDRPGAIVETSNLSTLSRLSRARCQDMHASTLQARASPPPNRRGCGEGMSLSERLAPLLFSLPDRREALGTRVLLIETRFLCCPPDGGREIVVVSCAVWIFSSFPLGVVAHVSYDFARSLLSQSVSFAMSSTEQSLVKPVLRPRLPLLYLRPLKNVPLKKVNEPLTKDLTVLLSPRAHLQWGSRG